MTLSKWVQTAKKGEVAEYHRGFLYMDRIANGSIETMACDAMYYAEQGLIDLMQARHGFRDYRYLAIKR